jgi:hypothetical protein
VLGLKLSQAERTSKINHSCYIRSSGPLTQKGVPLFFYTRVDHQGYKKLNKYNFELNPENADK